MGLAIKRDTFDDDEYRHFSDRLAENLAALEIVLDRPGFGRGPVSLGAELELSIVDSFGRALPINRTVLANNLSSSLQLELDRFNLEWNLSPVMAKGKPFSAIEAELGDAIASLDKSASGLGGRVAPIGILPTLTESELQSSAMTDLPRYRALNNGLRRIRGDEPFAIRIDGDEPLALSCNSVTLEGANTSFQLHLRVDPSDFAATYNAAQLMTPLALAVGANSPTFLGHVLWHETRVSLFKQAVDTRVPQSTDWQRAARVPFGHGWVRDGAYELFAEAVALHAPIIPLCGPEDPVAEAKRGGLPKLDELKLQQGTIWHWNRAVYDTAAGGHLRIEFRALPSGPTPVDMAANAAFLVGATVGMRDEMKHLMPGFPFKYAEYNFYRAAQRGLAARLLWPAERPPTPVEMTAGELIERYIPVAADGLAAIGVDDDEIERLLNVIARRVETSTTPARWQLRVLSELDAKMPRKEALSALLEAYLTEAASGRPVAEWARPG